MAYGIYGTVGHGRTPHPSLGDRSCHRGGALLLIHAMGMNPSITHPLIGMNPSITPSRLNVYHSIRPSLHQGLVAVRERVCAELLMVSTVNAFALSLVGRLL